MGILKHIAEECVGSIKLGSIGTFWSIKTFLIKKSYMKIQKSFLNYINSLCTIFDQKCLNTPKCPDTPQFYTTDAVPTSMSINAIFCFIQKTLPKISGGTPYPYNQHCYCNFFYQFFYLECLNHVSNFNDALSFTA